MWKYEDTHNFGFYRRFDLVNNYYYTVYKFWLGLRSGFIPREKYPDFQVKYFMYLHILPILYTFISTTRLSVYYNIRQKATIKFIESFLIFLLRCDINSAKYFKLINCLNWTNSVPILDLIPSNQALFIVTKTLYN